MTKKMTKKLLKERIETLEKGIRKYYMAIYNAQCRVDMAAQNRIISVSCLQGNEESPITRDPKIMKDIIMELPLMDYGCDN